MAQELRILSIAPTRYIAEANVEAARAAEALGFSVNHLGVADDLWYGGEAEAAYTDARCEVRLSPRPSADSTPVWRSPDSLVQLADALPALSSFYRGIVREFRPHICVLGNDHYVLGGTAIRTMNDADVPVLLLEEGFGHALAPRAHGRAALSSGARRLRVAAADRWHQRRPLIGRDPRVPKLPKSRPFGRSGRCTICAYCGFTAAALVRSGVPHRSVEHTGFPYYDQVVRQRVDRGQDKTAPRPRRLLVLSSGDTRFGWTEPAIRAWDRDLDIAAAASSTWQVSIRLHPGEKAVTLPDEIRTRLGTSCVALDEAERPARLDLPSYDLVIGEPSAVHQEAAILGVASVVVARTRAPISMQPLTTAELLERELGMLVLREGDDIAATLENANSPDYGDGFSRALAQTGRLIYDSDGMAGSRVAEVILSKCGLRGPGTAS